MNPQVDEFFQNAKNWNAEMQYLRKIVLECQLVEALKWKVPCYVFQNGNVVLIHGFKEYCALNFFKGALLSDTNQILHQQTENSTSARQIRFANLQEIIAQESVIKAYVFEAIELEKAGLNVTYKKAEEFDVPVELTNKLNENPALKSAFEALTPGRKKGYYLHFEGAKQSKTRETRIENCIPRIMKGKGLNDCICGLSKRMPNCDGSHKFLKEANS
jgi:uncharacterized protein YdeI (YjbR/CyaY-like superfamily)